MLEREFWVCIIISLARLLDWFYLLLSHWVALMSGAVSLALSIWQRVSSKGKEIGDVPFVWLAVFFLFFASYQTWQDEHSARQQDQSLLEETRALSTAHATIEKEREAASSVDSFSRPNFHVRLLESALLQVNSGRKYSRYIVLIVEITNSGAPSLARLVNCYITLKAGAILPTGPITFPDATTFYSNNSPRFVFYQSDLLTDKISRPIERGSQVIGYLPLYTPDIRKLDKDAVVNLIFTDAFSTTPTISAVPVLE